MQSTPYLESSLAHPLNTYGQSKADAEASVLDIHPSSLIIRTSAFFGPWDHANFAAQVRLALQAGREFTAARDIIISPTYVPDLVHASLDLLMDGEHGIWHLANQGELSWLDFACLIAEATGTDASRIKGVGKDEISWKAPRPRYSALRSERGNILPLLEDAVRRYANSV